jgi:prepilin-type N-terminal cleavage/methylation domain-containing protein
MKIAPTKAFTLVELLVAIVIIAVLVFLALPRVTCGPVSGAMTGTLSNARQLHLATQTMALDTFSSGGDGMEWTMMKSKGKTIPASLATYFDALVRNNYLSKADLQKLLTAPGRSPAKNALIAANICFKFFQVDEDSPPDQPLLVTANWQPTGLTSDSPYGKKGFVVFTKGGSGGVYSRPADVTSTNIFPTGSKDGHPYRYIILE